MYPSAYCFGPCNSVGLAIFIKLLCRLIIKSNFEII